MKPTASVQRLSVLLAIAALFTAIFTIARMNTLAERLAEAEQKQAPAHEEHLELAVLMGRMQRFHQKWWEAGRQGNAALAAFYLHEMEEAMEEVVEAQVLEDGVDVSAHMRTFGLPIVEQLERRLKEEGVAAMHGDAQLLVNSCNACHIQCGYPFVRIQVPVSVHFPDQDFTPVE